MVIKNLILKIQGQGHRWGQSSKSHVSLTSYRITSLSFHVNLPFLRYIIFKSKVKVIAQGHKVGITPYRLISRSFHVDRPSHSWDTAILNLTLKIQGQGHCWGQSWKSQHGPNIRSTHIPFVPCQPGIPFLSYDFFKIWPWKSSVKVMGEVTVQSHNVGLTSYRLTSFWFHVNRPS